MAALFCAATVDVAMWQAAAERDAVQAAAYARDARTMQLTIELNEAEAKRRQAESEQRMLAAELALLKADLARADAAAAGDRPRSGSLRDRLDTVDSQGGSLFYIPNEASTRHPRRGVWGNPQPRTLRLTKECLNNPLHAACR